MHRGRKAKKRRAGRAERRSDDGGMESIEWKAAIYLARDITHPRHPRVVARHRETWVWIHWQGTCRDHCRTTPPSTVRSIPATAPRLTDGGSRRSASASASASAGAAVSTRLASRRVASRRCPRVVYSSSRSLLASERA